MALRILRERLTSLNVTCLETLPKNATHTFKLRLIIVERKEARFIGDALDLSDTPLPDTVKSASSAWINIREEGNRYVIVVYTK